MQRFLSKLTHKIIILVLALIIVGLATPVINKQFNLGPKLSKVTGEVAGVIIENTTEKFLGTAKIAGAAGTTPYQQVDGIVGMTGNVGIGITNPQAPLEINNGSGATIRFFPGTKSQIRTDSWNSALEMYTTQASGTNNFNQLYLSSSGSVGIGMSNPPNKLHVSGNLGATGWIGAGCEGSCESSGGYSLMYANGTIVATTSVTAPTFAGNATSAGMQTFTTTNNNWTQSFYDTPASQRSWREMSAGGPSGTWWFVENMRHSNASNYWGKQLAWGWEDNANRLLMRNIQANNFSGWVEFITTSNIASQSVTYATSAGSAPASDVPQQSKSLNQWVNTDSAPTFGLVNTGTILQEPYYFHTQGDGNLVIKNRYSGYIMWAASYTGTAWKSDIRLKENIKPLGNSLDKLNQLQSVSFDWKEHKPAPYHDNAPLGFIAQQFEKIYPELVYTDNITNMKMIDYGGLFAPIIKSIQELDNKISTLWNMVTSSSEKIDILTKQVTSQQKEIDVLKTEIESLKNH